jgi:transposase
VANSPLMAHRALHPRLCRCRRRRDDDAVLLIRVRSRDNRCRTRTSGVALTVLKIARTAARVGAQDVRHAIHVCGMACD